MIRSPVNLKRVLNLLETEKRLLMKMNKKLLFCSSKTTTSSCQSTDKFLRNIPLVYLKFAFNVENENLMCFSRECFELVPYISKLRRYWKRKGEEAEKMAIHREDEMMFAPSTPFLEDESYTQYTLSTEKPDQFLLKRAK